MQENNNNYNNNLNGNRNFYNTQNNLVNNNENLVNNSDNINIESNDMHYNQPPKDEFQNQEYYFNNTTTNDFNTKKLFTKMFYIVNMKFIVPAVFCFGIIWIIFGPLGGISKGLYTLILSLCFGYLGLLFILFIIHKIRNIHGDVQRNGFSILGKTLADKIKSVIILCVIIFFLIMFLYVKFKY